MDSIQNRYALALFSLAKEENLVEDYQEKIKVVRQIIEKNPDYVRILSSYFLSFEEKHALLDQAFSSLDSPHIISFLKVIVDHHRSKELLSICKEFHSLCNAYLGIEEGIVYSVIPLNEEQMQKITEKISTRMNCKVDLKNVLDAMLLGGIKVVVHDHIFDGSLLFKVDELKKQLLGKVGGKNGN